jgi:hexokinase
MKTQFKPLELSDFARYYGFHYDNIDQDALIRSFCLDMRRGLAGLPSSMPMIPSYLRPVSHCPPGKEVIALDAGGTNLRAARVRFDAEGKAIIEEAHKYPMPGTQGHLTADEFFDKLAEVTAPLLSGGNAAGLGFCFSYSMKVTEDADGIPDVFSKELDIPEVVGRPVGKGLRDALEKRGVKPPERIVLLNDTVATLLTGISSLPQRMPSKFGDGKQPGADKCGVSAGPVIGFILGTGFNTAYPETKIPKINFRENDPARAQVVVAESGTFLNPYQGLIDREFDAATKNPGTYTTEKAISGAYLGNLHLHAFKKAVQEGLLSFARKDELLAMPVLQTKDLNEFLHNPLALEGKIGGLFGKDEAGALSSLAYLSQIITERAAVLSAAVLAGTIVHMEVGFDPFAPVRIAVEGTTYVLFSQLRRSLEAHLHAMLQRDKPRSYIIQSVEDASLIGAAVAALSE